MYIIIIIIITYITSFINCGLNFLCCHLVVATFVLLTTAKWLVSKTNFFTSQMIGSRMTYNVLSGTLNLIISYCP